MAKQTKRLGHLLTQNQSTQKDTANSASGKKGPGRPKSKEQQISFTIRSEASTKSLLMKIQKVKQLTVPGSTSQGDVIKEALELLAKKMKMTEMEKKYAKFLEKL